MDIALIGYGNMGRLVKLRAEEANHHVVVIVNEAHADLPPEQLAETLRIADVAVDFTVADAVERNVAACMLAGIPIVVGTTGWNDRFAEIKGLVDENNGSLVYGSNFSVGVNLFFRIADYAADLISKFPEYEPFIEEQHHSQKRDSPSGTALKLGSVVAKHYPQQPPIASTRAGNIPGTHRVGFDGVADQILLEHIARTREGFALGAIMAAEWIIGKTGVNEFSAVMDELIARRSE